MVQKAYSGDLIKVTKAFDEPYNVGDVLEVDFRQSDMGACDDNTLMTTEGYFLQDGDYTIYKAQERVIQHVTDKQIEAVKDVYKRACEAQSSVPFDEFDGAEIRAIKAICSILKIEL